MAQDLTNELQKYKDHPFGELTFGSVRVGRVTFNNVRLRGREALIGLEELLQAACEKTQRIRVRKDGTRYPEPLPLATPGRQLSEEIADYLRDMTRRNLRPRTIEATARTLGLLQRACGDIRVSRIDHQHIYRLWDLMRWAPPGAASDPELKALSVEDLILRGQAIKVEPPAPATLELHRRFLVAFFNVLVKAKAIPVSPMEPFGEIKKDLVQDTSKPDRLFSDEELQRIFDPSNFIPWAKKWPHRWWGPIIGLYTGARVGEVAQLKVADIIQERGMWCISIRKTIDEDLAGKVGTRSRQSLKGDSAVRVIPLAQPVLDAGFLDFLEDMKACAHPRLFPHLSAGVNKKTGETNARYSQGLLNQFSSYLKDLGFPKGVGFHAFRHTIATELYHRDVPQEEVALITGHSLSKKVPVLQDYYLHKRPDRIRVKQARALELYRPSVELPKYQAGQFKERLGKDAKFYP
jgi:integrase